MSKCAWVTLATTDAYAVGALVVGASLARVGSQHGLVVLSTRGVSPGMLARLHASPHVQRVLEVQPLDSGDALHLAMLARPDLGVTFTKLHCWTLTDYDKCVFLDADTLVVSGCDELFEREELSAAADVGWPDCFNSGVFVFQPSLDTHQRLLQHAQAHTSFDGGDQGLLNSFWPGWATGPSDRRLPFLYNVTSVAFYSYLPALHHYRHQVKIVHFIGAAKPWLQPFDWASRTLPHSPHHLQEMLQLWWELFLEHVQPHLTIDMGGAAGLLAAAAQEAGAEQGGVDGAGQGSGEGQGEAGRRLGWEAGRMDYMGADSFDNIWAKISSTLAATPPSPPAPAEVSEGGEQASAAPQTSHAPSTPGTPDVAAQCTPVAPGTLAAPGTPDVAAQCTPAEPCTPVAPGTLAAPGTPRAADTQDVAKTLGTAAASGSPGTTAALASPAAPCTPLAPCTLAAPGTPDVADTPEEAKTPGAAAASGTLGTTAASGSPAAPGTPDVEGTSSKASTPEKITSTTKLPELTRLSSSKPNDGEVKSNTEPAAPAPIVEIRSQPAEHAVTPPTTPAAEGASTCTLSEPGPRAPGSPTATSPPPEALLAEPVSSTDCTAASELQQAEVAAITALVSESKPSEGDASPTVEPKSPPTEVPVAVTDRKKSPVDARTATVVAVESPVDVKSAGGAATAAQIQAAEDTPPATGAPAAAGDCATSTGESTPTSPPADAKAVPAPAPAPGAP